MKPEISVIIPTHNRRVSLVRTLESLANASVSPQLIEVIVVADGCTDDTATVVRSSSFAFELVLVEQATQGAAAARNQGAAHARANLLLFLDDDIEATAGLIDAHLRAHTIHPGNAVIGFSPLALQENIDFFGMELRTWWNDYFEAMRRPDHRFTFQDIAAGNLSLPAEIFQRVGRFDSEFPYSGGEDGELGVRLIKAQVPFYFEPQARGIHHDNSTLDRSLLRSRQEAWADVNTGQRHPDMQRSLPFANFQAPTTLGLGLIRYLAIHQSHAQALWYPLLRSAANLFEYLRVRRLWRQAYGALRAYAYWQGVIQALGSEKALAAFMQGDAVGVDTAAPILVLDLAPGIEAAERILDAERPAGLRLYWGQNVIGELPVRPGAERLRGIHLRPLLANEFAFPLLKACALAQHTVGGGPIQPSPAQV